MISGYGSAWVVLLGLAGMSFGASFVAMGALSLPVAAIIAAVKIRVILVHFMHIGSRWNMNAWAFAVSLGVWLMMASIVLLELAHRFSRG